MVAHSAARRLRVPERGFAHFRRASRPPSARSSRGEPTSLDSFVQSISAMERGPRVASVRRRCSTLGHVRSPMASWTRRLDAQLTANHVANRASRTQGRAFSRATRTRHLRRSGRRSRPRGARAAGAHAPRCISLRSWRHALRLSRSKTRADTLRLYIHTTLRAIISAPQFAWGSSAHTRAKRMQGRHGPTLDAVLRALCRLARRASCEHGTFARHRRAQCTIDSTHAYSQS